MWEFSCSFQTIRLANKRCNKFWDLNDGANLKKLELRLEGGLSDVSGLNTLENLTFTLSPDG